VKKKMKNDTEGTAKISENISREKFKGRVDLKD